MLKTQLRILLGFIFLFLTIFPHMGWSQMSQLNPSTPIKYYEHRSWEEIDGVEIDHVFDIDQDEKGYIWLATNRGLLRFDSSKIESYNFKNVEGLETETVRHVEIGADNTIWFATRRGLFYIKDKVAYEQTNPDGSPVARILSLEVNGGGIPHYTLDQNRILYKIVNGEIVEIEEAGSGVFKVFKGRNGKLLAIKAPIDEPREIIVINQEGELEFNRVPEEINVGLYSLSEGPFGEFYAGGVGFKLFKIDDDEVEVLDEGTGTKIGRMHTVLVDHTGSVFYSKSNGLERNHRGKRDILTSNDGLTNNSIEKVFFDRDGNLWVGTLNGLNYFSKGPFSIFLPKDDSLKSSLSCVFQFTDGTILVGSKNSGLFLLDNEFLIPATINASLGSQILGMTNSSNDNEVYVTTEKGAFLLRKEGTVFKLKEQISDQKSGAIYLRKNGELWFSNKKRTTNTFVDLETVFVKKGNTEITVDQLEGLQILDYYEDKEEVLWIFTSRGLYKYFDNSYYELEKVQELKSYWISSKVADRNGKLWVGTLGTGLHLMEKDTVIKYDTRNGMPMNQAIEMLYSEEGGMWLFKPDEQNQLERLIPYEDNGVKKIGVGEYYTFKHRFNTVNESPSYVAAKDGSFLIPGIEGLIRFNPKDNFYSQPRVRFDRLVVDNETFAKTDELIFGSDYDDFEFHYSAVDFTRGESQIFEVKLEGLDEEWKSVGSRQVVYYSRLPAGSYTFKVRLNTPEFGKITLEAPINIEKKAVWYLRTNVIVFFIILVFILIYAIFQFRINQVKNQRAYLELKVDERTAELNELNQNLEATVAERTREIYKINEELTANEERYKYALEASTDGIWDWDVIDDEIQFSPAIYTMLGYEPYEFPETRKAIYQHIHPEDVRKEHMNYHNRLKLEAGDEMLLDEYRMIGKQGNIVWVQVKGKVVERDAKGNPSRMVGTHVNITQEKKKSKEILDAVLNTEFVERSRISKDIHDGLQQTLTISSLNFQWVRKDISNLTEKGREKFEQGWKYLQSSINESRQVAHSLMPKEVLDYGVIAAYERRIEEFDNAMENTRLNFYHNFKNDKIENQQVEIILYRILQEALNNIAKYSKAKTVTIQLKDYKDIYMLTIEDDGVGFEVDKMDEKGRGLGFKSMRNRLDAINGFLEIESMPGKGTTVLVEINK